MVLKVSERNADKVKLLSAPQSKNQEQECMKILPLDITKEEMADKRAEKWEDIFQEEYLSPNNSSSLSSPLLCEHYISLQITEK